MALFIWRGDMAATFPGVQKADHSTLRCAPGEIVELDHDPHISRLVPYEPKAPAEESPEGEVPETTAEQVEALEAQVAALQAEVAPAEAEVAPEPEAPTEPAPEPPAEEAPPA